MTNGTALPMCARWYTVGPQTYMPTFAGGSGSATSDFVDGVVEAHGHRGVIAAATRRSASSRGNGGDDRPQLGTALGAGQRQAEELEVAADGLQLAHDLARAGLVEESAAGPRSPTNRSSVSRASSPRVHRGRLEDLAGDLPRLDERAGAAQRAGELDRGSRGRGEVGVGHLGDGVDREPVDARQVEADVVARQAELVEVCAHRCRRDPLVAQVADRRVLGPLRELLAVLAEQETVVDHLGQLAAERPRDPLVHLLVGPVVGAADDVGDAEIEIVGDRGELIGRGAVGAGERRPPEPDRAVGIAHRAGVERLRGRLGVPLGALALPERAFLPADPEPAEIGEDRLLPAGHVALRVGVVDAQDEHAGVRIGIRAVGGGAEGVPEMERARRARREADADTHRANLPPRPAPTCTRGPAQASIVM